MARGDGRRVRSGESCVGRSQFDRIYVYTPDGHVIDMTPGATPVDFAYRVHTEVGHKCRGAKVNGRVTSLSSALRSGDQVEIITGDEVEPDVSGYTSIWVRHNQSGANQDPVVVR